MKRLIFAAVAVGICAAALLVAPSGASARAAVDLHKVNLGNRAIPGSTCYSHKEIAMHNGHGVGGRLAGTGTLVADEYGKPVYGDVTHDGRAEAFVAVDCSTGGGTAGSQVKFTWVVFTGGSGTVQVLGVLSAQHQWLNAHPTVLQAPKTVKDVVSVHETLWFADDPDCCGSTAANVTWTYTKGALRVRTSTLTLTDRIVTSTSVGRATIGQTPAALKKIYGSRLHSAVYSTGCRDYWHGPNQAKSFGAFVDFNQSARVFGIYAPNGSVTRAGVGTYATVAQIKNAYAGHQIIVTKGSKNVYVRSAGSWLGFGMDTSQSPAFVRSIRVGQLSFVDGAHTCTN